MQYTAFKEQFEILRSLAGEVKKISGLPIQKKTMEDWKGLNSLKPRRPMYMIDQLPWGELQCEALSNKCTEPILVHFEKQLRETLFRWNNFPDDRVVTDRIYAPRAIHSTGYGINFKENIIHGASGTAANSHAYLAQITCEEEIDKIKTPKVTENKEASAANFDIASECFNGILKPYYSGVDTYGHTWDLICRWIGIDESMFGIVDNPEFIHKVTSRAFEAVHEQFDQFEALGLLNAGNPIIHCTGAYSDDLPGFDEKTNEELEKYRFSGKNVWTYGASQIFSMVSPAVHDEFEIEYQKKWYSRFGLGYYGCCEPLDRKIDIIRKLPNVRKISVSPWADINRAAESMNGDYVFSNKPNPAYLANDVAWNPEQIKHELIAARDTAQRYGNPCELILKDVSTLGNKPERLGIWAKIASEVCGK